ncbi:MAG: tetratricopeptide repeat protein, partial [Fibrobacteria bacterium]
MAFAWAAAAVRGQTVANPGAKVAAPPQDRGALSQNFRAFDDSMFTLAYDVFLAAGNLKQAYSLASEAVRQAPGNEGWRERLAKTAEWSGNPKRAFEQWEYLCGKRRDNAPYREALRLAGTLRDHEASVRIWESLSRIRALEVSEWISVLNEYEESGEPRRGIERLRARIRARPDSLLMDKLAGALIRTGSDLEALETLQQLADRFGNSPSSALQRAKILCRRGNLREAQAILERSGKPDSGTVQGLEFRRLQASILLLRQEYGAALTAYGQIFATGIFELEDIRELLDLAKSRDSSLALRASVEGWKRYAYPDFFIYYLERCVHVNRWDLASHALANLTPKGWSLFVDVPYFLSLSSRVHQHEGKDDLARSELLEAVRLDWDSDDLRAGLLWLLIEQGRINDLETYMALWEKTGVSEDMIEPLAMAHKLLYHNRQALEYFRRLDSQGGKGPRKDLLFLFSYVDLLEQAGDGEGTKAIY